MERIDVYMKIIFTIIAISLAKVAFFSSPPPSFAQFPFMESSKGPIDVNIASIDNNELYMLKNGDIRLGGKTGPILFENGAVVVRIKKD
jgi:hypothetical protein